MEIKLPAKVTDAIKQIVEVLKLVAPLKDPTFTGIARAPQPTNDSPPDTIATKEFVASSVPVVDKRALETFPIGAAIIWPSDTLPESSDYAFMFGNAFDPEANPINAKLYPGNRWPDMRDYVVKGNRPGRALLSHESDGNKSHSHTAIAQADAAASSTTSSFDYGNKVTDTQGNHQHGGIDPFCGVGANNPWRQSSTDGNGKGTMTDFAGSHAHNVYIGSHNHTIQLANHTHAVTVQASGNAETTVKNLSYNFIVRKG